MKSRAEIRAAAVEVVARTTGPTVAVYERLCLGTGRMLHSLGDALAPEGARWGFLLRCAGCLAAVAFMARLFERAPGAVYAVPVAWLLTAWQMSDSSATPPPGGGAPSRSEEAAQRDGAETTLVTREGMLIYLTADRDQPAHTHVRVEHDPNTDEATATLIVGDWHTKCGACDAPAAPADTHHQSCGARFIAIRHSDGRGNERVLRSLRPDLPVD